VEAGMKNAQPFETKPQSSKGTRQKAMTEILKKIAKSEEILEAIGDGISIQDRAFKIIYENKAHIRMTGGYRGEYCYKAYQGRESICVRCPVALAFKDSKTHKVQKEDHANGARRYFEITASPLLDKNGKIIAGIEIVRDVTRHKQTEKKLRESEEKFRALAESTSDWIWEVDRNGIYTYVNLKIEKLLGYLPEEVIGKSPFDFMPGDEAERIRSIFNNFVETKKPFSLLENINIHKDGRRLFFETSGVPILNEKGSLLGYRGIDRDITERKLYINNLKKNEKELKKRIKELEEFYEIAVGRELRMIELKKEIMQLKEKLNERENNKTEY
jgi:PAS domain S-box-containing protein